MKFGNRLPVDVGVILVAGLTMALSGCTPAALAVAGFSPQAAQASPPQLVSARVDQAASRSEIVGARGGPVIAASLPVGAFSVPVGAFSIPTRCFAVTTPSTHLPVGSASAPECVVLDTGRAGTAPPAPVGDASVPQCPSIVTPTATLSAC
jgi:hypothetical protein